MITTAIVIVGAFIVGLVLNRLLRRRVLGDEAPTLGVHDLVTPLLTLAVLVLAFVLVMGSQSYGESEKAARTEAGAVDHLFQVSSYAPATYRQTLQADTICYARAVDHAEWRAMRNGGRSGLPGVWTTKFRGEFGKMTDAPQFGLLVAADEQRAQARHDRLSQATPAIPKPIFRFMVITMAAAVLGLAFCLPFRRGYPEMVTLFVLVALMTSALLLIHDVDRPFSGSVKVRNISMHVTDKDATAEFGKRYGDGKLPCDAEGRPT